MTRTAFVALATLLTLATSGCSTDASSEGTGAVSPGPAPASQATRVDGRDQPGRVSTYTPGQPVATIEGTVRTRGETVPTRLEVLSLDTDADSTVLQIRVTPSREVSSMGRDAWSLVSGCTDGITLVDPATSTQYQTGIPLARTRRTDMPDCLAANDPGAAGPQHALYLFAYYGPLPPGVKTVNLMLKGFPASPVPVRRV